MSEKRSSPYFFPIVMGCCLLIAVLLTPVVAQQIAYSINRGAERAKNEAAKEYLENMPAGESRIPWVVKRVAPSVVGITTVQANAQYGRRVYASQGEGSGVIVDKTGYLLTNFHVVKSAEYMEISLSDGRRTDRVKLVGYDATTDLAVLKIDLPDLTEIGWGDSTKLEVGEQVLAIGNPYGFSHTVTSGIVSAKERYADQVKPEGFLQTDAAVNPGNSGGPLVDLRGELVGINTAIYGESFRGISLAIPSSLAKKVYEIIRDNNGSITHGWLGVGMEPMNQYYSKLTGVQGENGVVVSYVMPGSPAAVAGLEIGDVLIKWGDKDVTNPTQFSHWVILTKPGEEITLELIRKKERKTVKVKVGSRPVEIE